jgi:hypothetical protein
VNNWVFERLRLSENIKNDFFTYFGGGPVVNPSVGIILKRHAISATGVS